MYQAGIAGLNTSIDFDSCSNMITFGKDRALSIFDLRSGSEPSSVSANVHGGNKAGRAISLTKLGRILCTGFAKDNRYDFNRFPPMKVSQSF